MSLILQDNKVSMSINMGKYNQLYKSIGFLVHNKKFLSARDLLMYKKKLKPHL